MISQDKEKDIVIEVKSKILQLEKQLINDNNKVSASEVVEKISKILEESIKKYEN